jgi:hypothetical protein
MHVYELLNIHHNEQNTYTNYSTNTYTMGPLVAWARDRRPGCPPLGRPWLVADLFLKSSWIVVNKPNEHAAPALEGGERGGRPGPPNPRGPTLGIRYVCVLYCVLYVSSI